eukprot:NODE_818_length_1172_cov_51.463158_g776_i0.p1 GENE.NODE_818_length_1172_cov_51.463158_g776_i0~~NODE_818_length_1172_cov_51.463158_g776_i0.p1  ORF type:complete len:357 (-),score=74.07 NODE_818_length_1172_cov_51.463158_g776_i0:102-1100(-)
MTVYGAFDTTLDAIITAQEFNTTTFSISFTTSVPLPFINVLPMVTSTPFGGSGDLVVQEVTTCPNSGVDCLQEFLLLINPPQGFCSIDGTYELLVNQTCHSGSTTCVEPLSSSTLSLAIDSIDFCSQISILVETSLTLGFYASSAYMQPKLVFFGGETLYFKVDVTDSDLDLADWVLTVIEFTDLETSDVISFYDGSPNALTDNAFLDIDGSSTTDGFRVHFDLNIGSGSADLFDIPNNSLRNYEMRVTMEVSYHGTLMQPEVFGGLQKRSQPRSYTHSASQIFAVATSPLSRQETLDVEAVGSADSGASELCVPLTYLLISTLAVISVLWG